ncbi:RNA polymerase sigma factor [Aeoliella sp. SH292]|uniref:RNA polymerase sigma factor n=1 Tax=Aeoliella sp. SH292 TaxID=3454464 RepID=UPI003F99E72A
MEESKAFCDRHGPLVWQCAYRVLGNEADALDCCQEVLYEMWQRGPDEQWNPPRIRWLATRRAIDLLRRVRRHRGRMDQEVDAGAVISGAPSPESEAAYHELTNALRRVVAELPPRQAEAFWLRTIDELSYDEIALQLSIEVNAVHVLVHRARKQLQSKLAKWVDRCATKDKR